MARELMKWVVGVAVALLHAVIQFFSWATATRPEIDWLWRIISFPAFRFFAGASFEREYGRYE